MDDLYQLSQTYLRLFDRPYVRNFLREKPFENRMTVLLGQRGIGKTTVLIQYLREFAKDDVKSEKILYLPADHFQIKGRAIYEIAEDFLKYGGQLICFDEIHKYANWSQELKSIYDTFPDLKVIASGSSALEIYKGSHDLSRRAIKRQLPGLSFREYLEVSLDVTFEFYPLGEILKKHGVIGEKIVDVLKKKRLKILPLFKKYLIEGYYPMVIELDSKETFLITLEQNIHTSIESDLLSANPSLSGESIVKIKRLLVYLSQQTPFKVDIAKIQRALSITDSRTIKTYLQLLENAGCIQMLYHQNKNLNGFEKPEKIYLENTNQIYALGGNHADLGNIRETFFVNATSKKYEIFYSEQGDFVVEGATFEVGGKGKTFRQIKGIENSFLALDEVESGINKKIPLWLFGFLY